MPCFLQETILRSMNLVQLYCTDDPHGNVPPVIDSFVEKGLNFGGRP